MFYCKFWHLWTLDNLETTQNITILQKCCIKCKISASIEDLQKLNSEYFFYSLIEKKTRKVIEFNTRPLLKREIVICKVYKSGIGMFVIILHIFEDKINDKFLGANQNIITSMDELIRPMKAIIWASVEM